MIFRFSVTILISVLLGVIFGTSTSFIPLYISSKNTEVVKYVAMTQPVILADNEGNWVFQQEGEQREEVIYFKEIEETQEPESPEELKVPEVNEIPAEEVMEATPIIKVEQEPLVTPPSPTPEQSILPVHTLNAEVIFNMINEKRVQSGLSPLEKETQVCELAVSRTPELGGEFASGHLHRGFHKRNLPYWASENVIYMKTEENAVKWWMNSSVHRGQLLGDYKYSCVACLGESCTQIFTNLLPK